MSLAMMSSAIDERVTERIERDWILRTVRDDLAQLIDGLAHLIARLELKDPRESQVHGVWIFLEGIVQGCERTLRIILIRKQSRLRGDRLDSILRPRCCKFIEMLQPFFEPLLLGLVVQLTGLVALAPHWVMVPSSVPVKSQGS